MKLFRKVFLLEPNIKNLEKNKKVDKLIEILESENIDKVEKKDLIFLSRFNVGELVQIIKNNSLNSNKKKILSLFNKYYLREYLLDTNESFEVKYKLASV